MSLSILVAGIGNIFLGDDGFGSEVARRLATRTLPDGVRVTDFGIRGFDLAFALAEERELTILVDASARGGRPGTVYVIEPDLEETQPGASPEPVSIDTHGMDPMNALRLVRTMGNRAGRILLVACEPESFGDPEQGRMGLSAPVAAAVDEAVRVIESLLEQESERAAAATPGANGGIE